MQPERRRSKIDGVAATGKPGFSSAPLWLAALFVILLALWLGIGVIFWEAWAKF